MADQTPEVPLSRTKRVPIPAAMGRFLLDTVRQIQQIQANPLFITLQTMVAQDQQCVAALAKDAGFDLKDFEKWDYEAAPDGTVTMLLIPAPLPMPENKVIAEG